MGGALSSAPCCSSDSSGQAKPREVAAVQLDSEPEAKVGGAAGVVLLQQSRRKDSTGELDHDLEFFD